jgi:D-alanyl-D-alanine carboxypeptidase/D-alanyl-D-alanine-endopeptidase (penicillin-binding protein 4)
MPWNFRNYLQNQGIAVSGNIYYTDTLTVPTDTLYINTSPSMLTIINHINKTSNNIYAEAVLKLLGKGSNTTAITEMKTRLKGMGIQVESIKIADGCGLSSEF